MLASFAAPLLDTIYPPRCLVCPQVSHGSPGLCAGCWTDVAFVNGAICDSCGMPVPGADSEHALICDTCVAVPPAWDKGRCVFLYEGTGRRIVLALKHGDRLDMVPQLANWLLKAGGQVVPDADIIAPVPLHWFRLFRRRYNQAAELARQLARLAGREFIPDLLVRRRATGSQNGLRRDQRFENVAGAFALHKAHRQKLRGRRVLLIDDVMTSGATLSACADVCRDEGATRIDVCVLARVAQRE